MRTPRMVTANGLDRITTEAQNLARLQAGQTPLAGGENPELHNSDFSGVTPRQNVTSTPHPLAGMTPRGGQTPGPGATRHALSGMRHLPFLTTTAFAILCVASKTQSCFTTHNVVSACCSLHAARDSQIWRRCLRLPSISTLHAKICSSSIEKCSCLLQKSASALVLSDAFFLYRRSKCNAWALSGRHTPVAGSRKRTWSHSSKDPCP